MKHIDWKIVRHSCTRPFWYVAYPTTLSILKIPVFGCWEWLVHLICRNLARRINCLLLVLHYRIVSKSYGMLSLLLCLQSLAVLICLFFVVNQLFFDASYDLENYDDAFLLSLTSLYWIFLMFWHNDSLPTQFLLLLYHCARLFW